MKDIHPCLLSRNKLLAYRCLKGYLANRIDITVLDINYTSEANKTKNKNKTRSSNYSFIVIVSSWASSPKLQAIRLPKLNKHLWDEFVSKGEASSLLSLKEAMLSLHFNCRPLVMAFGEAIEPDVGSCFQMDRSHLLCRVEHFIALCLAGHSEKGSNSWLFIIKGKR